MIGLAFVLALLVGAAALVILDLVLLARREWHKARVRQAFQERVRTTLARDAIVQQLPLPEEADDYLDLMAMRDAWQSRASAQTGNRS